MEGLYSYKHCSTPGPINSWKSRRVDGVAWEMMLSLATSLPLGFRSQQLLFLRNLLPTTTGTRFTVSGESSKVPLYQSKYAPEFPCACI
jgi:hypothetical protein